DTARKKGNGFSYLRYVHPENPGEHRKRVNDCRMAAIPSIKQIMHLALTTLLNRMDSPSLAATSVIKWSAPVPSFGDLSTSLVATIGLNPSNREFVDDLGQELCHADRRFHTLGSLGLDAWSEADTRHLQLILLSCSGYFRNNPYDRWFKKLDQIVSGTSASFYTDLYPACHLDLIPYATSV